MIKKILFIFLLGFLGTHALDAKNTTQATQQRSNQAIIFDIGDVIVSCKKNRKERNKHIATALKCKQSYVDAVLKRRKKSRKAGESSTKFWEKEFKKRSIKKTKKQISEFAEKIIKIENITDKDVIKIIEKLKKSGYRVGILSNVNRAQAKDRRAAGVYKGYNPLLLSYELGLEKPNKKIYTTLLKKLNLVRSPKKCIFIDDKKANVKAAKKAGIDAIQFVSAKQLAKELKKRGIRAV